MDVTSLSQSHCSGILLGVGLKSQGVVHGSDNHMFAPIHLPRSNPKTNPVKYPMLPNPTPNQNNPTNFSAPDQPK